MFSEKGEIKHLDFDDHFYGPEFEPLAHALKKLNLHPHIICESATKMSEDARIMKGIYDSTQILWQKILDKWSLICIINRGIKEKLTWLQQEILEKA